MILHSGISPNGLGKGASFPGPPDDFGSAQENTTKLLNFLAPIFLLACLTVMPTTAPCAEAKFDEATIRLVDRAEDKSLVIAEMTKAPISSNYPYKNAYMWGGDEERMPGMVITSMNVTAGGKNVLVPLSAYGNLGDPNRVWLEAAPGGFMIKISGSDGGCGHDATLFFVGNHIVRKLVVHGEFPDYTEEITYPPSVESE